jgi:hypothetical protein
MLKSNIFHRRRCVLLILVTLHCEADGNSEHRLRLFCNWYQKATMNYTVSRNLLTNSMKPSEISTRNWWKKLHQIYGTLITRTFLEGQLHLRHYGNSSDRNMHQMVLLPRGNCFRYIISTQTYCDMHAYLRPLPSSGPRSTINSGNAC